MDIILDSNIICSNFLLRSKDFKVLDDYLERTDSKYIFPKVIIEEIKGVYKRMLLERIEVLNKDLEKLNHMMLEKRRIQNLPEIDVSILTDEYYEFLRERLKIKEENIIEHNTEYMQQLVDRAISRTKPFNDKGNGFRDSLIWLTVKEFAKKAFGAQVAFISNNSTDFSDNRDKTKLAHSLIEECNLEEIKVNYYNNIRAFIESHSTKIKFLSKEWISENLDDEWVSVLICDHINSSAYDGEITKLLQNQNPYFTGEIEAMSAYPDNYEEFVVYEMIDGSLVVIVTCSITLKYYAYFEDIMPNGEPFGNSGTFEDNIIVYLSLSIKEKEILNIDL